MWIPRVSSSTPEAGSARSAWEREYAQVHAYTTSYRDELDRGVEFLLGHVRARGGGVPDPILECACGRGRNLLPLASIGHRVLGVDHALTALARFRERAEQQGLAGRAHCLQHDLRRPLPVADASIGTVLDITAVDNLVNPADQARYGSEVARVLRRGGLAVVVTFDRDDGYYARFLADSPWPGTGVVEDPHTGIRNQLFRAQQLDALFVPPLERIAGNRFDFIDEAAREQWTRRFHLRLYRKAT